jgi:hypothetical protein
MKNRITEMYPAGGRRLRHSSIPLPVSMCFTETHQLPSARATTSLITIFVLSGSRKTIFAVLRNNLRFAIRHNISSLFKIIRCPTDTRFIRRICGCPVSSGDETPIKFFAFSFGMLYRGMPSIRFSARRGRFRFYAKP